MLLELAHQIGLGPKKISAGKGGEYHCPCPACGGDDRFCIWPEHGRYWCRRCDCKGDAIEFCRAFLSMTFQEALARTDADVSYSPMNRPKHKPIRKPTALWVDRAEAFVESAHHRLLIDPLAVEIIKSRGLSLETARVNRLGWNPQDVFYRRHEWGLDDETENHLHICLPKGIVIPSYERFRPGMVIDKIKIRRADWADGDKYPKYQEIPGSSNSLAIFGFLVNQRAIVVESELDALVVLQEVGEFCSGVALGGAQKRPDDATTKWLKEKKMILYSLDCDEAGREQYEYWRSTFSNLRAWPADSNKSPADSFVQDRVDLKKWYLEGIAYWAGKL